MTKFRFDRPNVDSGPTRVSVGMLVVDIKSIDSAQQRFTADVAGALRWKDSRLAHSGRGVAHYPRDQIWHPRVVIKNETNSVSRRLPESVEAEADNTVLYRQRYVGAFTQSLHLKLLPLTSKHSASISLPLDMALKRLSSCQIKDGSTTV